MKENRNRLLILTGQLPARLTAGETASVLNCGVHDVPVLVAARLLKPLGNPPRNCVKYFASVEIVELAKDRVWLGKMSNSLYRYWQDSNARRKREVPNSVV